MNTVNEEISDLLIEKKRYEKAQEILSHVKSDHMFRMLDIEIRVVKRKIIEILGSIELEKLLDIEQQRGE